MAGATLLLAIFASAVSATRYGVNIARETPHIPGYFANEAPIPLPTSPPRAVRNFVKRDAATCGWMLSDGSANVCGDNQYCTTSASGSGGIWNCCNPGSCYTQTACSYSVECNGDTPYCQTSYMTDASTTYSRFMCGTEASVIHMVYSSDDTPQYTQSLESASSASEASAAAASSSAAAASDKAADASKSSSSTGTSTGGATSTTGAADKTGAPTTTLNASSSSSSGLSGGAIGGIVVAAVAGIAIVAGLLWYIWKLKNKNAANPYQPAELGGEYSHPQEMGTAVSPGYQENYKPYPYGDSYAHVQGPPQELPSEQPVHELDPTPRPH